MNEDGIRAVLQKLVAHNGGVRPTAHKLGLSAAYLSDILSHNRGISAGVAASLGFELIKKTTLQYRKVK
jgi:hypothetical protein